MLTDSDDDCLSPTTILPFPNESTIIKVRGPNNFESTLNFSQASRGKQLHRPRDPYNPSRMLLEREKSPMSVRSVDFSQRGPHHSYTHNYGQNSVINGQAGRALSPAESVQSFCSNATTVPDIISAVKGGAFRKKDLMVLKNELTMYLKGRSRKGIAKRRNLRMFRARRRRSGGDSGDQESNSSGTSDDCVSTRTGITMRSNYSRNFGSSSRYALNGRITDDDTQSTRTDYTARSNKTAKSSRKEIEAFRRTVHDRSIFRDCTENLRQSSIGNINSLPMNTSFSNSMRLQRDLLLSNNATTQMQTHLQRENRFNNGTKQNRLQTDGHNNTTMQHSTLKDRFNNTAMQNTTLRERFENTSTQNRLVHDKYLLPSQRFNKSTAVPPILEEHGDDNMGQEKKNIHNNNNNLLKCSSSQNPSNKNQRNDCSDSEESENIFSSITAPNRNPLRESKQKRKSPDEIPVNSKSKKKKLSTPDRITEPGSSSNTLNLQPVDNQTRGQSNTDFVFAKPTLPLRKGGNVKNTLNVDKPKEAPKAPKPVEPIVPVTQNPPQTDQNLSDDETAFDENSVTLQSCTSDVSTRPSFIKRKLFTQTLDVTEKINTSNNSPTNSPQTKDYNGLPKEKNKARKLVTNQCYLSRDIQEGDNNILDLIHKIVPPDRMNVTSMSTQNVELCQKKNDAIAKANNDRPQDKENMCDIASVLTMMSQDELDMSDTFTDEEIFKINETVVPKRKQINKEKPKDSCVTSKQSKPQGEKKKKDKRTSPQKNFGSSKGKLFWQTDSDSDTENRARQPLPPKSTALNDIEQRKKNAQRPRQTDSATDTDNRPQNPPSPISTTLTLHARPASKAAQKQTTVKNNKSAFGTKTSSLFEIADSSSGSIEDFGRVSNKRTTRIRAEKAAKEKKTPVAANSSKTAETQSISEAPANSKNTRNQPSTSKTVSSNNKTAGNKKAVETGNSKKTATKKKDVNSNPQSDIAYDSDVFVFTGASNKQDDSNSNAREIRRPRKSNIAVKKTVSTKNNPITPDTSANMLTRSRRKFLETPETDISELTLNVTRQGKGRPRKNITTSPQNNLQTNRPKDMRVLVQKCDNREILSKSTRQANTTKKKVPTKSPTKKTATKVPINDTSATSTSRTRRSRNRNPLSCPLRKSPRLTNGKSANIPQAKPAKKTALPNANLQASASNKENVKSNKTKLTRQKNNSKTFSCCESDTDVEPKNGRDTLKMASKKVNSIEKVPDSAAIVTSSRPRPEISKIDRSGYTTLSKAVRKHSETLGYATSTIGVGRRCQDKTNSVVDNNSLCSMSSFGSQKRSRRRQFLHFF